MEEREGDGGFTVVDGRGTVTARLWSREREGVSAALWWKEG